ncbi:hypothetical protein V3C99_018920 [Haemonchus contortus]
MWRSMIWKQTVIQSLFKKNPKKRPFNRYVERFNCGTCMCGNENVIKTVFHGTMDSTTPSDRSINGLVVFLTLFVFLAGLTSGLLVCLVKIWCGQKKTCSQTPQEQRQSVAACSMQDSDSDDDTQPPIRAPAVRRFSQRIIALVQRGPERRPTIEVSPEPPSAPSPHTIHGAVEDTNTAQPGSNPVEVVTNDPSCVIYL